MNEEPIATSFYFQPLGDGNVLIVLQDDDGRIVNSQILTGDAFRRIPVVVGLMLAVERTLKGTESGC